MLRVSNAVEEGLCWLLALLRSSREDLLGWLPLDMRSRKPPLMDCRSWLDVISGCPFSRARRITHRLF